jgi:hypothetical protein
MFVILRGKVALGRPAIKKKPFLIEEMDHTQGVFRTQVRRHTTKKLG